MWEWLRSRSTLHNQLKAARRELREAKEKHRSDNEAMERRLTAALDTLDSLTWEARRRIAEDQSRVAQLGVLTE